MQNIPSSGAVNKNVVAFMKHEKSSKFCGPFADSELSTSKCPFVSEKPKLAKLVANLGLTGLANNTKWNELLTYMRGKETEWVPAFRFKCIDTSFISSWDKEWWYHLPYPFIAVYWIDLQFNQPVEKSNLSNPVRIDHSEELITILKNIGFEFEKGKESIRIFGYAPKDYLGWNK